MRWVPGVAVTGALALTLAGCGHAPSITTPEVEVVPASDTAPSWSPDGMRIAYAPTAGSVESDDRSGIYIVDTLGTPPVQVLAGGSGYHDWSQHAQRLTVS